VLETCAAGGSDLLNLPGRTNSRASLSLGRLDLDSGFQRRPRRGMQEAGASPMSTIL
jgi:hypothetical protein